MARLYSYTRLRLQSTWHCWLEPPADLILHSPCPGIVELVAKSAAFEPGRATVSWPASASSYPSTTWRHTWPSIAIPTFRASNSCRSRPKDALDHAWGLLEQPRTTSECWCSMMRARWPTRNWKHCQTETSADWEQVVAAAAPAEELFGASATDPVGRRSVAPRSPRGRDPDETGNVPSPQQHRIEAVKVILTRATVRTYCGHKLAGISKYLILLVPERGFEPPTY